MYYLYILHSNSADKYYVGIAADYKKRWTEHNNGESRFTSAYNDWKLVAAFEFSSKAEAARMEQYLKKSKSRRLVEELVFGDAIGLKRIV